MGDAQSLLRAMNLRPSISPTERRLFLLLAAVAWAYIIARAVLVPWVNDEALTYMLYVEPGRFLPYASPWDANNHLLNSALMSLAYEWTGLNHLGSRLGNVLAFVAYAWAVFRLGERISSRLVRWCFWASLMLCPLLIELFSLARGYGMAVAFWLAATAWLVRFAEQPRLGGMLWALGSLLLADLAVMMAVPVYGVALSIVLVIGVRRMRGWQRMAGVLSWLVLGAAPFLFSVQYGLELRERGGYFIGGLDGFVPITVSSLMQQLVGSDAMGISWVSAILVGASAAYAAISCRRKWAITIPILLLGADVASRVCMARILEVNYPIDRAAAHLVPWALVSIAYAIDAVASSRHLAALAAVPLLALPVRTALRANLNETALWTYQSPPEHMVRRVASALKDRMDLMSSPPHMHLSMALESRRLGLEAPRVEGDEPFSPWLGLRIVQGREAASTAAGFHIIDSVAHNGLYLIERDAPVPLVAELRSTIGPWSGTKEFKEFLNSDTLMDAHDRIMDITGPIDSDGEYVDLTVNVTIQGPDGGDVYYERYNVSLLRPRWNGESLRLRLHIPPVPHGVNRKIYIWNIGRQPLRAGPFTVTLQRLAQ